MSKRTDNSLFIVSSMPRLYQQLLKGIVSYEALGKRIIKQIQLAHAFRRVEQVRELSNALLNIPIKECQLIAQYYLVWCKCREREYDSETLERIIDQTNTYKVKGLLSRAAFEGYKGNTDSELYFYKEALKASPTISEFIEASKAIAVVKAKEGLRSSAIRDMENLIPIIRYAEPLAYCDVLNSYAVELGELGRLYEASNISRLVLASPFAYAYPEWQATANDLRGLSKSFAAINQPSYLPRKVLYMPANRYETEAIEQSRLARVFSFQAWKKKMAKKKEKPPQNAKEIFMWMINIFSSSDTSDHERRRIYEAAAKIIAERNNPKLDDDGA